MSLSAAPSPAAGFWRENPGLVQLLGLCPLLAVTTTLVSGVGLGLVTMLIMMGTGAIVAALRKLIPGEVRIAALILIITAVVTLVQLALNAYVYPLYLMLGIYVPLIATNCLVLERAETVASRQSIGTAVIDGCVRGLELTWVLMMLGAIREILGRGTLLFGIDKLLGAAAKDHVLQIMPAWYSFLLVSLPPGAFICLGLLIAVRNKLSGEPASVEAGTSAAMATAQDRSSA